MILRRFITLTALLLIPLSGFTQQPAYNCEVAPQYRDFDFWIGDWEVRTAKGDLAGHNTITAVQSHCALEEQWHSAKGGTGQSLNYYSPQTQQWRQLWLDAGQSIIDITGGLQADSMILEGTIFYLALRKTRPFRGKWTPLADGRVRQFFEEQDDEGAWQVWFDGYYSRLSED